MSADTKAYIASVAIVVVAFVVTEWVQAEKYNRPLLGQIVSLFNLSIEGQYRCK